MKNLIKISFAALAISISVAACSGNNSTHVPDSTRVDSENVDSNAGKNGTPVSVDSTQLDRSGSGGTDSTKKN